MKNSLSKKQQTYLVLNVLIVVLEILGFALFPAERLFRTYTKLSNLLALLTSFLLIVYTLKEKNPKKIPYWVLLLRFMAVVCLMVTFLVVVFMLIPQAGLSSLPGMLFKRSSLYHHTLCPLLSVISFIFFEGNRQMNKRKNNYYALLPTLAYAAVAIPMNIMHKWDGPYFFLRVYVTPIWMVVLCCTIILVGKYFLAKWILYASQRLS